MFNKELKEDIKKLKERILKAEEKLSTLHDVRKCSVCGKPFFKRVKHTGLVFPRYEEIKNCEDCDLVVEKREKAKSIALNCPDEVIKLGNKKQCKDK